MIGIRIANIQQRYGSRIVLDIPALEIAAGRITALVGPSGAGKSTLLRLLNFLEPPTAGEISWNGRPILFSPPLEIMRRVTTVFQRPLLLNRSVAANLTYGLRLRQKRWTDDQINGWLVKIGLAEQGQQPARLLSAGEMQRVALARALMVEPDILLLDEPTANLDPANVNLIESLIREDQQRRRSTVVMVTHNLFQARRMGEDLVVLINGQLVESGPTEMLFERPQAALTAAFLQGKMVF